MSQLDRRRFLSMSAAFGMIALSDAQPAAGAPASAPAAVSAAPDALTSLTLTEAARRLRAREITSTALTVMKQLSLGL